MSKGTPAVEVSEHNIHNTRTKSKGDNALKPATCIKRFLQKDAKPIPLKKEFLPFKQACSDKEWLQFARDSAAQLGVPLDLT